MHRHIIVVTFLEWLNWNNKGLLRVAPQRLVWCQSDNAAVSFQSSLQFAPDLEPADDAFLIADVEAPPDYSEGGTILLPLVGTKFEVLSERSSRLFSASAKRMNAKLDLATESIQDAWVRWKECYNSESADQQARRIWSWAWEQSWPSDPQSPQEQLLMKTRQCLAEMSRLLAEKPETLEKISGTSAEPWLHMALAAEQNKLLAPEIAADWREASKPYIQSCRLSGQLSASFFPKADITFLEAYNTLPFDHIEMVELAAVATAEHHALRLNAGQEPDLEAVLADFQFLSDLTAKDWPDRQMTMLSTALLALGRLLPGTAVGALMARTDLRAGWGGLLLQGNEKQEIAGDGTHTDSSQDPAATLPGSIPVRESEENESGPSGMEPEARTADVDRETEPPPDIVAPDMSEVSAAVPAGVAPSEKQAEGQGYEETKKKNAPKHPSKAGKARKSASKSNKEDPPPEQGKLL